jgi:predicted metal-dependent enzyme (double-stranded beta helix superfamily)
MSSVVVVGGGFCGAVTAVNLARLTDTPVNVTVVNAGHPIARGVAYGTRRPEHLLNVVARNMSALADLVARLGRLDLTGAGLDAFVRFADGRYQRNIVRASENYHVWVMCWQAGQRSPIHDHGSSVCAVRVLRGTATVTLFERAASGDVKATRSEDVPAGGVIGTQDGDLHQVSNLQGGGQGLVTLHVSCPPLLRMGTYSILDSTRGVDLWTELTEGAGI